MKKEDLFETVLLRNKKIKAIIERTPRLNLPNWYLCAGCIAHTFWNYKCGFDLENGIKDYDLVYFDKDTSYEKEDAYIKKGRELFKDLGVNVEIRNEARVHLWYEDHFGGKIEPYNSVEEAIRTFPTTATAIAIRTKEKKLEFFAPFGFDDILDMVARPNKAQITEAIYLKKVERWSKVWPDLEVIPW